MASYRLALTVSAEKELNRLPNSMTARIAGRIEKLGANPRPNGCKKLRGGVNEWRIRVGDYRVIYTVEDSTRPWKLRASPTVRRSTNRDQRLFFQNWCRGNDARA